MAEKKQKRDKIIGESKVWFAGMGLALGIIMIITLLSVIVLNALPFFWPGEIAEITLKKSSPEHVEGSKTFHAEFRREQTKAEITSNQSQKKVREYYLFLGNRDVYGYSFKFINTEDIDKKTYPEDIILIEREEHGFAIGVPTQLNLKEGKVIPFTDPQFGKKLQSSLKQIEKRRKEIRHIEEEEIGKINTELLSLQYKERKLLQARSKEEIDEGIKKIEAQREQLQKKYLVLSKKAKELRDLQEQETLTYQLSAGPTKTLSLGAIYDYYYPNRLGLFGKIQHFFINIGKFLTHPPREANTEGGILPCIIGTFLMTVLLSIFVTPFGVIAAVYLHEYARQGVFVRIVRIAVNNLAGVPSIVFGVFGLGFFVYIVGGTIDHLFYNYADGAKFGTGGIMWASFTLALMTLPIVIVSTEEALSSVPRGMREASLACGASKWQTIQKIILPSALPGIITGVILAMAIGAGEVAPLMLVGVVKLAPELPFDLVFPFGLERKFMHLGFHIYDLGFQSPDSEAVKPLVFATTLLLILIVIVLNLFAIVIREKLRRKYATGAF